MSVKKTRSQRFMEWMEFNDNGFYVSLAPLGLVGLYALVALGFNLWGGR